jgi:hypothetical protein
MRLVHRTVLLALAAICIAGCNDGLPPVGHYAVVSGRVVDAATGAGITNATVSLNGGTLTQASDENGNFKFTPVPSGDWDYTASAAGYAQLPLVTNAPALNPGETRTVTIALTHS